MSPSTASLAHVVFAAYGGWGHVRPLCVLATRLLSLRQNLLITLLTSCQTYSKVEQEVARNIPDPASSVYSRLRIVGLLTDEQDVLDYDVVGESFSEQLQNLLSSQCVYCSYKQEKYPVSELPSMLVVGLFGYRFLEIARQRSRSMKILVVLAASMLSLEVLVEPFGADTHRQLERKVRQHMGKTGKSLLEAAEEVLLRPSDAIVQPLGLPAMHSHEIYPQKLVTQHPMVGYLHLTVANLTHECEDMIVCSMTCIEPPKVVQTLTDFFALTSRKMHIVGPVVRLWKTTEQTMAEQSPGVASFIDGLLQMHGRQSMVYISFGTVFWSSQPEMVWTLLDVLLEKSIPFIMAQASPLCQLPEHVAQKVRTSRIGLITPWAPQQLILEHPATGWFVTHGGFNSILESVHAGVPMICWPFAADQPLNTVQLTENLDIAYELLEVRTGEPGLKPIYRTGKAPKGTLAAVREETRAVLDRAFGEDGARKRGNILKLREVSLGMWAERGAGRLAAEEMLSSIGL